MSELISTTTLTPQIDGFTPHGVARLSPSSLYVWMAQPSLWLLERLLHLTVPVGCAAHRGSAVEKGVIAGLFDTALTVAECQDIANAEYDRLTALSADPRRVKEREGIAGMVATGLTELRQYGRPSSSQGFVEHRFDGLPVPIVGYYDLRFDDSNIVVDLKTTHRIPSDPNTQHCRQCALYVHGSNAEARLAYTSSNRIGVYQVKDPAQHLRDLVNIAHRLNRFLAISADPYELAGLLTPDLDSFWWTNPVARAHAKTVFGL
jgi:hypothetical protein